MSAVNKAVNILNLEKSALMRGANKFGIPVSTLKLAQSFVGNAMKMPVKEQRRSQGSYPIAQNNGAVVYSDGTNKLQTNEQITIDARNNPLAKVLADIPRSVTPVKPASGQWGTYQSNTNALVGISPELLGQKQISSELTPVKNALNNINNTKINANKTQLAYKERLKEKINSFLQKFPMKSEQEEDSVYTKGIPVVQRQDVNSNQYNAVKRQSFVPVSTVSSSGISNPLEAFGTLLAKIIGNNI